MIFVVIDEEHLDKYIKYDIGQSYISDYEKAKFIQYPSFKMVVYRDLVRIADKNKLNSLEVPKNMMILKKPFSVDDDLLTPTWKLKRNVARKYYADDIKRMYEEGPQKFD